jgi:hypothetical protein
MEGDVEWLMWGKTDITEALKILSRKATRNGKYLCSVGLPVLFDIRPHLQCIVRNFAGGGIQCESVEFWFKLFL